MKVKILVNDVEREVTIKGLKGKHRKEFFKKIGALGKVSKDLAELESMSDFQDYWDGLLKETSDLTEEEYDDLELEEQNKLIVAVRNILLPFGSEKDF